MGHAKELLYVGDIVNGAFHQLLDILYRWRDAFSADSESEVLEGLEEERAPSHEKSKSPLLKAIKYDIESS